jgi:S1-C subfamily serine protease
MNKNQNVNIQSEEENSTIFIENKELDLNKTKIITLKKTGAKQVIVRTTGFKDEYIALVLTRTNPWIYPLAIIDFFPYIYTFGTFSKTVINEPKTSLYNESYSFVSNTPFKYRTNTEKYLNIQGIYFNVLNPEKDLSIKNIQYEENIEKKIESNSFVELNNKSNENKPNLSSLLFDEFNTPIIEKKLSFDINRTIEKTKYKDTLKRAYQDFNNSLFLSANITSINEYNIISKRAKQSNRYKKYKVNVLWKCYNVYNELLDTINITSISGDFVTATDKSKIYSDILEQNFCQLQHDSTFSILIQKENLTIVKKDSIIIKAPHNIVGNLVDAKSATFIIKGTSNKHSTGFAISNDGYILTNYQVIAGNNINKQEDINVIFDSGKEMSAKIVRSNKSKDIVLLKIDTSINKAFLINSKKGYQNLTEVYTIGASQQIELGQTISNGLILNEEYNYIQNIIQLNINLYSGSIGAPVFEKNGNLHGIVQRKFYEPILADISFALPIYLVKEYLNIIIE